MLIKNAGALLKQPFSSGIPPFIVTKFVEKKWQVALEEWRTVARVCARAT